MTWILLGILVIMVAYAAHLSGTVKGQKVRIDRLLKEEKMCNEIYNRLNCAFMDAEEIINSLQEQNMELTVENSKMQEEMKNNRKPKIK